MPSLLDITIEKPNNKFKKRRFSRVLAVQCMYNISITTDAVKTVEEIIKDIMNYSIEEGHDIDQQYFLSLIKGCIANINIIHRNIQKHLSTKWKVNRLAEVIHAILTIATYEILYSIDVDVPIIINEYIEIAKMFNHDGESGFVNGVLDKIAIDFPRT